MRIFVFWWWRRWTFVVSVTVGNVFLWEEPIWWSLLTHPVNFLYVSTWFLAFERYNAQVHEILDMSYIFALLHWVKCAKMQNLCLNSTIAIWEDYTFPDKKVFLLVGCYSVKPAPKVTCFSLSPLWIDHVCLVKSGHLRGETGLTVDVCTHECAVSRYRTFPHQWRMQKGLHACTHVSVRLGSCFLHLHGISHTLSSSVCSP